MSQDPRRSSRSSSVIKHEELERKLAIRNSDAEIKALKSRSKALETVHRQELNSFEEEARRLSEFVDRVYGESDPDNNSNHNQSLEWDSDECTSSPSFVTINTSEVSPTVLKVIEDILNSSATEGEEENLVPNAEASRRTTSTDNNFLASSPVANHRPSEPAPFIWPP